MTNGTVSSQVAVSDPAVPDRGSPNGSPLNGTALNGSALNGTADHTAASRAKSLSDIEKGSGIGSRDQAREIVDGRFYLVVPVGR